MTCPIFAGWICVLFSYCLFNLNIELQKMKGNDLKMTVSSPFLHCHEVFHWIFFLFKTVCRPLDIQKETAFCRANFAGPTANFSGIKLLLKVMLWGTLWKPTESGKKKKKKYVPLLLVLPLTRPSPDILGFLLRIISTKRV